MCGFSKAFSFLVITNNEKGAGPVPYNLLPINCPTFFQKMGITPRFRGKTDSKIAVF